MTTDTNANLAHVLDQDKRLKVLRRVAEPRPYERQEAAKGKTRSIILIDVETTGLDPETDAIIELAFMEVVIESEDGGPIHSVVSYTKPESWLQEPGREIPERVTLITGIDDVTVQGEKIDDDRVVEALAKADLIIAHNARFDRGFIEKRYPESAGKAWACSMSEIDWQELAMDGRSLGYLLMQTGYFNDTHQAGNDVWTLFHLLGSKPTNSILPFEARTCLDLLLAASDMESYRVEAVNAPFGFKDRLKAKGYRWDPKKKVWWTELRPRDFVKERGWFSEMGLPAFVATPVDATQRHR